MSAGIRILTGQTGERFSFDPGSLCLELLLTGGPGQYQRYEILHAPADLVDWLIGSRLVLAAPLTAGDLRIRAADLRAIRMLRDTMWRVAKALAYGRAVDPADLDAINERAGPPPRPRIDPTTRQRGWVTPITGMQVMGAVARDAIDLVSGDSAARVRECAASNCYLLFLDTSRSRNRRWCSMERCGNRNKVRSYRSRRQAGP